MVCAPRSTDFKHPGTSLAAVSPVAGAVRYTWRRQIRALRPRSRTRTRRATLCRFLLGKDGQYTNHTLARKTRGSAGLKVRQLKERGDDVKSTYIHTAQRSGISIAPYTSHSSTPLTCTSIDALVSSAGARGSTPHRCMLWPPYHSFIFSDRKNNWLTSPIFIRFDSSRCR